MLIQVGFSIIDKVIVPQFGFQTFALRVAAGQSDDAFGAHQARDLTGNIPDGAGGSRNDDGFASLRPANIGQAKVGGHPGITQNAEMIVPRRVVVLIV